MYSVRTQKRQIVHPNTRIWYPVDNVYPVSNGHTV